MGIVDDLDDDLEIEMPNWGPDWDGGWQKHALNAPKAWAMAILSIATIAAILELVILLVGRR